MNVAVKFYSDVSNPKGIPGEWPAEVREIGEDKSYEKEPGPWSIMTVEQYKALIESLSAIKEAFDAANPEPVRQVQTLEQQIAALVLRVEALESAK
jgi:hypothetical protein